MYVISLTATIDNAHCLLLLHADRVFRWPVADVVQEKERDRDREKEREREKKRERERERERERRIP